MKMPILDLWSDHCMLFCHNFLYFSKLSKVFVALIVKKPSCT